MGDPYMRLRGQPVVVHLLSGRAVAGTIYASWRQVLELRGAMELDQGRAIALDGATCTPFASIDYFQIVDSLPDAQQTAQMAAVK